MPILRILIRLAVAMSTELNVVTLSLLNLENHLPGLLIIKLIF